MKKRALVWFRRDLRLVDNPALDAAVKNSDEIVPLYVCGTEQPAELAEGDASQWWLHHALKDLDDTLNKNSGRLHIEQGKDVAKIIADFCEKNSIDVVFWNRRYQPAAIKLDSQIKKKLTDAGVEVKSFNASVFNEPHDIKNKSGKPFQVFTPYWKHCREIDVPTPIESDFSSIKFTQTTGCGLDALGLLPMINWDTGFYDFWKPTRHVALIRLENFSKGDVQDYGDQRDIMAEDGTSQMSPYLHFGQISPREVFHRLKGLGSDVHDGYIRQLYWRDFAHHLLYHFPHSVKKSLRSEYDIFPWEHDEEAIERWQKGQTGFPVIDAAMRQLWQTGWMHNRARMIVGSFLVKHLLQHWQVGADWFWDTLVDADLANNTMGWQWVAGSGADAAPYFRVFNPLRQAERFDKDGEYVRKYVPELAKIKGGKIHEPWSLSESELEAADVKLGGNYPEPMIDLDEGRKKALAAYNEFKEKKG